MDSRAVGWCFTINNWTDEQYAVLHDLPNVAYIVYGKESGENGTPHLQGYLEIRPKKRFSQVKALLPAGAHIELRRGTGKQASDYCKKDGDFVERGELISQGCRSDLHAVKQLALEAGMRGVTATQNNFQQISVATAFLSWNEPVRDFKPNVTWICGPSGIGKSYLAKELLANFDTYIKSGDNKWWPGYDGHDAVIIDDLRDTTFTFVNLLGILGRDPFQVEYKGGQRQLLASEIVVTSIYSPEEFYRNTNEPKVQLYRRIDTVINLYLNKYRYEYSHILDAIPQTTNAPYEGEDDPLEDTDFD